MAKKFISNSAYKGAILSYDHGDMFAQSDDLITGSSIIFYSKMHPLPPCIGRLALYLCSPSSYIAAYAFAFSHSVDDGAEQREKRL